MFPQDFKKMNPKIVLVIIKERSPIPRTVPLELEHTFGEIQEGAIWLVYIFELDILFNICKIGQLDISFSPTPYL